MKQFLGKSTIHRSLSIAILLSLGLTPLASAGLGQSSASIESDRMQMNGVRQGATSGAGYTVEEIAVGSGLVREFVSAGGVVFAVAWSGATRPDLSKLLGSYFAEYQAAEKQNPPQPGRRHHTVQSAQVVVEHGGHMGAIRGRAYLPAMIPKGVGLDEIR